jgi:hypothetical protein
MLPFTAILSFKAQRCWQNYASNPAKLWVKSQACMSEMTKGLAEREGFEPSIQVLACITV